MSSRSGYRFFMCDECRCFFKRISRDCYSPSRDDCPECGEEIMPHDMEPHPEWPVDGCGCPPNYGATTIL